MKVLFQGMGWKVRLSKRRTSYSFTLAKELVIGNALKQGDVFWYYLTRIKERLAIILFLDGKEKPLENELLLQGVLS